MKIEISQRGVGVEVELPEGPLRIGGSPSDGLCFEGLLPGLVTLHVDADQLVLESWKTLAVNGVPCPPRVRRLLMADESLALAEGLTLRPAAARPPPPPTSGGTLALLRGLLGGNGRPGAASRAATLTCLTGLDLGRTYPLADGRNELGRGQRAEVRIRDRAVSRRHACLTHGPDGYTLSDLGSPNGVFVNGQKLTGPRRLEGGEVLELGHSLMRFTPPPAPPEPPPSAAAASLPSPSPAPPPAPPQRLRLEWLLIPLGAALTLGGAVISWILVR